MKGASNVLFVFFLATATAFAGGEGFPLRPEPAASSGWVVDLPQGPGFNPRTNPDPGWGTLDASIKQIHAYQFVPIDSGTTYSYNGGQAMRYRTGGTAPWFDASLSLPSGVSVVGLEVHGCDSDASHDMYVFLLVGVGAWGGSVTSGTPGCGWFYYDLSSANITINNATQDNAVEVNLSGTGTNMMFGAVNVYYRLNVSPAPATATFADVPTSHPFFQYVEALAASGITSGCGGGNFCPNNPLTRGQMAVFLSKALGLHFAP